MHRIIRRTQSLRSLVLLVALLLVMATTLAQPAARTDEPPSLFLSLAHLAIFCFGGYLLASSRRWLVVYLAVALPTLGLGIIDALNPGHVGLSLASLGFSITLGLLLFRAILSYSLFDSSASQPDRILAGICGYLLLALFWSSFYLTLCSNQPGALVSSQSGPVGADPSRLLYFSIVTLTTLGYGDIAPGPSPIARMLCSLEALVGTLYVAVFIASVVGSRPKSRHE